MQWGKFFVGASVAATLMFAATPGFATVIDENGTFTTDDQIQTYSFTFTQTTRFEALTLSYAGGVEADGTVIPAGGFDPELALFNATTGLLIDQNDDGNTGSCGAGSVGVRASNGLSGDACISDILAAGTYILALTQYDNGAVGPNLSDGFFEEDAGDFTPIFSTDGSCTQFCDTDGVSVNGPGFAAQITVPEPAALPILAFGLVAIGFLRRKFRV